MNIIEHNKNGLVYLTADGFEAAGGVAHGFSTRLGGVSEGIYATLNLGKNRGDAPDRVRENYRRFCAAIGADVDKVAEATRLAHEKAPELLLTGPIQYDAAIDADTARTKMPGDPVAGRASVFIFPDLNTGNNTYKAVQRAADAIAIGPVLQGLRKPVNDLSRGCLIPDIVNTVAITAVQAQAEKGLA